MLSKKIEYSDKESNTDTTDGSPTKERSSSSELEKGVTDEIYARKLEKRRTIMAAIKSKVKISNILIYQIDQSEDTGDRIYFSDVYKIKGLLGVGGFGIVLAVENKETETHSAMKIWLKSSHALVINEECKVLSSFSHPNIVKFKRMYETKSRFLMEIEFCRGGHLKKMISK